ncbi:hypothetical protein RhiirA4_476967 [Rhizophagus irregularis]|uniref:Uncharacterized protein n=1 Tax=Rhizophagus irregularis TaxID=588596 RepID=A0A2I1HCG9_9GLOM|nr:hypothetical protein RhiirA4_476967 [Rhizophagus irregularis]
MIKEWRLKKQQEEDDKDDEDDSIGFDKLEEAVTDSKKEYILYQEFSNLSDVALVKGVKKKINELEEIFKNESHKMEWEHIRQEDKNWKQDEKEVGEKRPMMESPGSISSNESEEKKM